MLDAAATLDFLRGPPGNRKGQHSIRINQQWRLCFRWHNGDAFDVEITDYH
jgi:proteic killer suppression protein